MERPTLLPLCSILLLAATSSLAAAEHAATRTVLPPGIVWTTAPLYGGDAQMPAAECRSSRHDPAGDRLGLPAPRPALPGFPDHPGWPVSVLGGCSPPVSADLDPGSPGLETSFGELSSGVNLHVLREDGTPLPGWPVDIGFFVAASPAIGDIDADGALEIVVGDWGGNQVWALEASGTPVPGWPIPVGGNVRSTAALADLDPAVPGLEIIVGVQDGHVHAWHADGTPVAGWPVTAGNFVERCSPGVGDVDGDGDLEVFVGSWYDGNAGSTGGVYAFDHQGAPLPGWPLLVATHTSVIASPALADLDGNGDLEIIVGTYETNGRIHVWHHDGTALAGWPYTIPRGSASTSSVTSSPAVGDLDGDGALEVVCGSTGRCGSVYAWSAGGAVLPGWPFLTNVVVDGSSPVIGDLDGDGSPEIVVGSGSGFTPFGCATGISKAYVLRADGSVFPGFPVDLGSAAPPNPALADIDVDGDIEILLTYASVAYAWDAPGPWNETRIYWPYYHYGIDHRGVYEGPSAEGIPGLSAGGASTMRLWPNPGTTRVRFEAPPAGAVQVLDASGRVVRDLAAGAREWDGRDRAGRQVPSGAYWLRSAATGVKPPAARWIRLR